MILVLCPQTLYTAHKYTQLFFLIYLVKVLYSTLNNFITPKVNLSMDYKKIFIDLYNSEPSSIDKLQKISTYINIYINYYLYSTQFTNFKRSISNLLFIKLPYLIDNKFNLNGINRTAITGLEKDFGVYLNTYIQNNKNIVYRYSLLFSYSLNLHISLNVNTFIGEFNSKKFNLFHLLYYLGISNSDINKLSRFGNTLYLKTILKQSSKEFTVLCPNILNQLYLVFNTYINTTINIIFLTNFNRTINLYKFGLDIIYLMDSLIEYNWNIKTKNIKFNIIKYKIVPSNLNWGRIITYLLYKNLHVINLNFTPFISVFSLNTLSKKKQIQNRLITELFHLNPLLQYSEELNIISSLMHKNKVNLLSNFDQISTLEQRNINNSYLNILSFLNTSEGSHSGLISTLSTDTILTTEGYITNNLKLCANKQLNIHILNNLYNNYIYKLNETPNLRRKHKNLIHLNTTLYIDALLYPKFNLNSNKFTVSNLTLQQVFSYCELLTPFFTFNEPSRCLMSTHMQIQSLPIIYTQLPYVFTNSLLTIKEEFGFNIVSYTEGIVIKVSNSIIIIKDIFNRNIIYYLTTKKTNQGNIILFYPKVWVGERINIGQILANTDFNTYNNYNVGSNLSVTYGFKFGYEYEDAIILNQHLLYKYIFTSLHYEIFEIYYNINSINNITEYSTNRVPKQTYFKHRWLDTLGVIQEGATPIYKDLLATKITLNSIQEKQDSNIFKFLSLILGKNIREIKDYSIRTPNDKTGRIVKIECFSISNEIYLKLRIFLYSIRFLHKGDKLSGRYGNKGVVAHFVDPIDMPYLHKQIPDIITSPLGIPSRMNLGQLYETLLGMCSYTYDMSVLIHNQNLIESTKKNLGLIFKKKLNNYKNPYMLSKSYLVNSYTGETYKGSNLLGYNYYMKLIHMSKTKIHFRNTGPYSELLQQPLKGKSKIGGQRFGEMEMWALEAYGAAYNIQDIITFKSDSIKARNNLNTSNIFNTNIQVPSPPESLNLLLNELKKLTLNVETLYINESLSSNNTIQILNTTY